MTKSRGFTLIEVLIALVILSVGLLGLAGLQIISLKNNQSTYARGQANLMAMDVIDRIRANPVSAKYMQTKKDKLGHLFDTESNP